MRQRKQPRSQRERTPVSVEATRQDGGGYHVKVFRQGQFIAEYECTCKANVPNTATERAASILGEPHGRIMITKLAYL